jgi:hypothetical protein
MPMVLCGFFFLFFSSSSFFFFAILGFELRPLVILAIGYQFFAQAGLDCDPPILYFLLKLG